MFFDKTSFANHRKTVMSIGKGRSGLIDDHFQWHLAPIKPDQPIRPREERSAGLQRDEESWTLC